MTRRPPLFWVILGVFGASAVWWALTVPYDPARVYRAIPAGATFVSVHERVAERWEDFAANPLTRSLLSSAGVKAEDLEKLATDPATRRWVRKLAARETVVAYVPSLGSGGPSGWVFASWIGGRSQRLRWMLGWRRGPRLLRIPGPWSWPIWIYRAPFMRTDAAFSFSLADGVLLGCLSDDPVGVRHLLAALDGMPGAPSIVSSGEMATARRLWPSPPAPDRGWIAPGHAVFGNEAAVWTYALTHHTRRGSEGYLRSIPPFPSAPALAAARLGDMQRLLGATPEAVCVLPASILREWLNAPTAPPWAGLAASLADQGGGSNALAFVALLGGDCSGRIRGLFGGDTNGPIRGLKIPTVLAGVEAAGGAAASERLLGRVLDRLNAGYRLGLIPHRVPVAEWNVIAVDETRDNAYGQFSLEERVGCVNFGRWFVVASNVGILTRLLENAARTSAPEPAPWLEEMESGAAAAWLWADMNAAGRSGRDALAAASLALLMQDAPGTWERRRRLAVARAWLEALQPLGPCTVRLLSREGETELQFRIGRRSAGSG